MKAKHQNNQELQTEHVDLPQIITTFLLSKHYKKIINQEIPDWERVVCGGKILSNMAWNVIHAFLLHCLKRRIETPGWLSLLSP